MFERTTDVELCYSVYCSPTQEWEILADFGYPV